MGALKFPGSQRNRMSKRHAHTFSVRFESQDDFLVEYTDQLRHGFVVLPLEQPLQPGTPVRLKVYLPDEAVLYLTGQVVGVRPGSGVFELGTQVRLDAFTEEQRQAIDKCVGVLLGSDAAPEETGSDPGRDEELEQQPITVLLVDDSVSHRIELGDALRSRGLRVRVAENGLLALASAIKKPPDVILTDVEMPQMDGWNLLRSIRQRKRLSQVPVVFLTRLDNELARLRGYRMGIDDYLPKTMSPDEIVARMQGVLARRHQMPGAAESQGLRGDLEHVRLGSLLSFLEAERRTGALNLRSGSDRSVLYIRDGGLVRVENLGKYEHPHDRVFELLDWRYGQFEFLGEAEGASVPTDDSDRTPVSYLLMEHARREDEANAR